MSLAIRFAPPPTPRAAAAPPGGPRAALAPARGRRRATRPGELALTATLFSLYVGFGGGARVLGAIETILPR